MSGSYGAGSWFHSRSSSSEGERDKIVALVNVSHSPKYAHTRWSAGTSDPDVIAFAKEISVDPATMQTKIRQFIRLGFLKDDANLPLKWSTLAQYWRSLSESGRNLKRYADTFEQFIITCGLTLYAFDANSFVSNPVNGYRPIPALLQRVNAQGFISRSDLEALIGDRNNAYWRMDLIRGGILGENAYGFQLTNNFPALMQSIPNVSLPNNLTSTDWSEIRGDALDPRNPYRTAILSDVGSTMEEALNIESTLPHEQQEVIKSVVASTDSEEEAEINLGDYKVNDSYSKVKTRRKQSAWSKVVCRNYNYQCCMPQCDINGSELVSAAHIKKYSALEEAVGHRANPQNGLCLCPICHALFDRGYFTLTHDLKIEASPQISNLNSNIINNIVRDSNGKQIDPMPPVQYQPTTEFINYHRKKVFKA